ncbi:MAG TPA: DUF4339 domain-containing protein [Polyangiaceae bacterium]|nr:DUF4339 domain-containing protein [Polyangiaceae bacterium]
MSYAATAQDETEDRYYTQVEAGDVRLFTLDQLDAAFNAGLIHENTYVCLEGDSAWLTLAEVAGLGDEEPESVSGPQPVPYRAEAPQHVALAPYSSPYYVPPSVPSVAPVSTDLSLDDSDFDMMRVRPKRRLGKVMALLTLCALGGLGFMVVQSGGLKGVKFPPELAKVLGQQATASLSLPKAAAPQPALKELPRAAAEAPKPEPVEVEETKPADAMPAVASPDSAKTDAKSEDKGKDGNRFSEGVKEALLNKDKKQASKLKVKKAARAAFSDKHGGRKLKAAPSGFKASGSAYDPLNAKL